MANGFIEQLKLYGLNPNDWKIQIKPKPDGSYTIVHRKDHQFKLKGKVQNQTWTQLEWQV